MGRPDAGLFRHVGQYGSLRHFMTAFKDHKVHDISQFLSEDHFSVQEELTFRRPWEASLRKHGYHVLQGDECLFCIRCKIANDLVVPPPGPPQRNWARLTFTNSFVTTSESVQPNFK